MYVIYLYGCVLCLCVCYVSDHLPRVFAWSPESVTLYVGLNVDSCLP